jgi:hypothetical protein
MFAVIAVVTGAVALGWARWYWPRTMRRVRQRLEQRGASTERFDAKMTSRLHCGVMVTATIAGIVLLITGVMMLVVGT